VSKLGILAVVGGLLAGVWWYAEQRDPTLVEPFRATARRLGGDIGQRCADEAMSLRARGVPWYLGASLLKEERTSIHVAIVYRPGPGNLESMIWCVCPLDPPGQLTERRAAMAALDENACMGPVEYGNRYADTWQAPQ